MAERKKIEGYLLEKRNEILWSMSLQDYSLSQLAWVFGISKTAIYNIVKERPENWISPWTKDVDYKNVPVNKRVLEQELTISTYTAWKNLKARCDNENHPAYKNNGGRGISYIKRWSCFENFLDDMGIKPDSKLSIDRINNDGNYNKSNCRWSGAFEQAGNRRTASRL